MAGLNDRKDLLMAERSETRKVTPEGPTFIIKHGDVYYITLAVVAYDPKHIVSESENKRLHDQQVVGVRNAADLWKAADHTAHLQVGNLPLNLANGGHGIHTDPVFFEE
jgi:hypothetical protein